MHFSFILATASLAAAASVPRAAVPLGRRADAPPPTYLAANSGAIHVLNFDGETFKEVSTYKMEGIIPSWLAFNEPNMIYTYDENSNNTYALSIDIASGTIKQEATAQGCVSPVHVIINADSTRMVAPCYSNGDVSVWDIKDGGLKLLKNVKTAGDPIGPGQTVPRAHQAVMDPTGRFFAVNNLGTDSVVLIDSREDRWEVVNRQTVSPPGCGPRHGVFYPKTAGKPATHYMVVCENQNLVHVYALRYALDTIRFTPVQTMSTFGPDTKGNITNARAAEIVLSDDNKDVYVSNRLLHFEPADEDQDSIAHFRVRTAANATAADDDDGNTAPCTEDGDDKKEEKSAAADDADVADMQLVFVAEVSSGGLTPRAMDLNKDNGMLVVGHQTRGPAGLAVFSRDPDSGNLSADPVAAVEYGKFGSEAGFGPQFVTQIA